MATEVATISRGFQAADVMQVMEAGETTVVQLLRIRTTKRAIIRRVLTVGVAGPPTLEGSLDAEGTARSVMEVVQVSTTGAAVDELRIGGLGATERSLVDDELVATTPLLLKKTGGDGGLSQQPTIRTDLMLLLPRAPTSAIITGRVRPTLPVMHHGDVRRSRACTSTRYSKGHQGARR